MNAIAFDMTVADIRQHYRKGISSAYTEIGQALAPFGFERVQVSVYLSTSDDMGQLFAAILALKALPWFPICARYPRLQSGELVGFHGDREGKKLNAFVQECSDAPGDDDQRADRDHFGC